MKTSIRQFILAALFAPILSIGFTSCSDDDDDNSTPPAGNESFNVTVNMKQKVNGQTLELNTPNMPYSNERGQNFNVSRLRYLISKLHFHSANGTDVFVDGFFFVDVANQSTLSFKPTTKIPAGTYTSIAFYFGFDEDDNKLSFPDLNTANWNWPMMLGGGYHNMQLEGQYDSVGTAKNYATHFGTARNMMVTPTEFKNTAFEVDVDGNFVVNKDFSIDITMNVEQWYEDPFQWDFNVWNAPIMPIFDAQLKLEENGQTVFEIAFN